ENKTSERILAYKNPRISESGKIKDLLIEYDNPNSKVFPQKEQSKDTLKETSIDEVVVVGYGIKRKVSTTASSSVLVASADIAPTTVSKLSGKVAGV
ncbi:hypothetical protein ACC848_38730, partial [Rhizobium johnstonii]